MLGAQHIGAFGHEVDAAEDDELGVGMLSHVTGELVGVAGVVGELDDLIALIVMSENDEPAAKLRFRSRNTRVHLLVRQPDIRLRQRLALGDVLFLVLGQQRNQRRHLPITSISLDRLFITKARRTRRTRSPYP